MMAIARIYQIKDTIDMYAVELDDGRRFRISGLKKAAIGSTWASSLQEVKAESGIQQGSISSSEVSGWIDDDGVNEHGEPVFDIGDDEGRYQITLTLTELKAIVS